MKIYNVFSVLMLLSIFGLSGCVVRTYQVTKDRVDQDLVSGNRGYIMGQAPKKMESKERKLTRQTEVVEVELHTPIKFERRTRVESVKQQEIQLQPEEAIGNRGYISGTGPIEPETAVSKQKFEKYTVHKGDTLQKISQKLYGTTKKWTKIYEANKDILKAPNKIYPGQVINVPVQEMKEPAENLK